MIHYLGSAMESKDTEVIDGAWLMLIKKVFKWHSKASVKISQHYYTENSTQMCRNRECTYSLLNDLRIIYYNFTNITTSNY